MSFDKFSRSAQAQPKTKSPTTRSPISFTIHGDIDCENRKLCNLKDAIILKDATTKKLVSGHNW